MAFPGDHNAAQPMSNNTILAALERMASKENDRAWLSWFGLDDPARTRVPARPHRIAVGALSSQCRERRVQPCLYLGRVPR